MERVLSKMKKKIFKIKVNDSDLELYFKPPTHEEVLEIDMEYRKIYSLAIRNEIITQAEASKKYEKIGAWSKEDENVISDLMLQLSLLEHLILDEKQEKKNRREAALKAAKMRAELLKKMNTRTTLFDNTAESLAEQQKFHKFILLCTRKTENDELLFNDRDEYQEFLDNYNTAGSTLYKEAYFWGYDLPEDISDSWAEVKFLKSDGLDTVKEIKKQKKRNNKKEKVESKEN